MKINQETLDFCANSVNKQPLEGVSYLLGYSTNSIDDELRLYLAEKGDNIPDLSTLSSKVFQDGLELKGNGIRLYSKFEGWILSKLGYALKVDFGNNNIAYINKRSLGKLSLRILSIGKEQIERTDINHEKIIHETYLNAKYKKSEIDLAAAVFERCLKHSAFSLDMESQRFKKALQTTTYYMTQV